MNPLQIVYSALALVLVAGIGTYIYKCESAMTFKDEAVKLAKAAEKKAVEQAAADRKAKETADEAYSRVSSLNQSLARSLRDARSRTNYLPAPSPLAASPGRACFSRADLERTLQRLDAGVSDLLAEGDLARVGLDSAKVWAKDIAR